MHFAGPALQPSALLLGDKILVNEEQLAAGVNTSKIHMDWMIGSPNVEVDGILQSGERVALMRGNDWVEPV
ncbi:MAG: aminopeptidase [Armatimonadota bacterium]